MKKITLLVALLVAATSFSQVDLTYNTDDVITAANGVGCPGGDNNWARNFLLVDFPALPTNFELTEGSFGVQSSDGADEVVVVNVYASDDLFPASFPVAELIGSQSVTVPGGTTEAAVDFTFDTPVVVPAGTLALIVEVHTDLGQQMFLGGTAAEDADSWLKSDNCAVADYVTTTSIGFPDAHFYITVTAEEVLGFGDNLAELTSIYPNPTSDVLNVKLPSNVEVLSSSLYNILGQDTGLRLVNGTMNTANLENGVYILNVKTSVGTLTQKVVKQ